MDIFAGIDFGTSGARLIAIDRSGKILCTTKTDYSEQSTTTWSRSLHELLQHLTRSVPADQLRCIAIDGTSATLLPLDSDNNPIGPAWMYNDSSHSESAEKIDSLAPADSPARGPGSSLAKWLTAQREYPALSHCQHQADWLTSMLSGKLITDTNNALKLGYDAAAEQWPDWVRKLVSPLPPALKAGSIIGPVSQSACDRFGLEASTLVAAGTTDSTAAFIATGASQPGQAVTSLGSTLVIKILSETPVSAPDYGVYSQPLGDLWLVGGASNSGCAVLNRFFTLQQLAAMTPRLKPEQPTGLDFYPLPGPGERFPLADPHKLPVLEPRPDDDLVFFQALLEGIATIEARGYELLQRLGAPLPGEIFTVGGGSVNPAWQQIRKQKLGIPLSTPIHTEAAYGSALLARQGWLSVQQV